MGNNVAKDFHAIQVGQTNRRASLDFLSEKFKSQRLSSQIASGETCTTVEVEREGKHSVRFYKLSPATTTTTTTETDEPGDSSRLPQRKLIFHVKSSSSSSSLSSPRQRPGESITENGRGSLLFVTLAPQSTTRMIFRTKPVFKLQSPSLEGYDDDRNDLFAAARVDIDRTTANNATAYLSVVVGQDRNTGQFLYSEVYKAVKIPKVKHGALVMETTSGHLVGKASNRNGQDIFEVCQGADVGAVVAVASAVL